MLESQKEELLSKVRELEKSIHVSEVGNLASKNQLKQSHHDEADEIRKKARQDGFEEGVASIRKDHQIEIVDLRSQHREELFKIEREAEARGEEKARIEIEAQVKAFSIKISPYIKIEKQGSIVSKTNISEIGYQYQLMINGIPAFQPHIVIERVEKSKEIDQAALKTLIDAAVDLSTQAAEIYLSGAAKGAIKIGGIIKDINIKDIIVKDVESEKKDI